MKKNVGTNVKEGDGILVKIATEFGKKMIEDFKNGELNKVKKSENYIEIIDRIKEQEFKRLPDRINNLDKHEYSIIQKYVTGKESELVEEGKEYIEFRIDELSFILREFEITMFVCSLDEHNKIQKIALSYKAMKDMIKKAKKLSENYDMELTDILVWKAAVMTCEEKYTTIILKENGKNVEYRMPELLACRTPFEQYYIKRIKYLESMIERPQVAREIWKSKSVAAGLLNEMEMGYKEKVGVDRCIEDFVEAYKESEILFEDTKSMRKVRTIVGTQGSFEVDGL